MLKVQNEGRSGGKGCTRIAWLRHREPENRARYVHISPPWAARGLALRSLFASRLFARLILAVIRLAVLRIMAPISHVGHALWLSSERPQNPRFRELFARLAGLIRRVKNTPSRGTTNLQGEMRNALTEDTRSPLGLLGIGQGTSSISAATFIKWAQKEME